MQAIAARKGGRELPIDETAAGYLPDVRVDDGDGGTLDLAESPPSSVRMWEIEQARATACIFERWLVDLCARHRIAADGAWLAILLLWLHVECELTDRAMHPDEFAPADHGMSDADAVASGLSIVRSRPAIMTRCQGNRVLGGPRCTSLRPHGERYCDACREAYWRTLGWTGPTATS